MTTTTEHENLLNRVRYAIGDWTEAPRSESKQSARLIFVVVVSIVLVSAMFVLVLLGFEHHPWITTFALCLFVVGPALRWLFSND